MRFLPTAVPALLALVVLAGWQFDLDLFKRLDGSLVAMNPATAVAFLLCAIGVASTTLPPPDRRPRWPGVIAGSAVMLIGLLKLIGMARGWTVGIDSWLFAGKIGQTPGLPSRMAPNTAINFLMVAGAILAMQIDRGRSVVMVQVLGLLTALIAMLAIVGYSYQITAFYGIGSFIPMALHTATSFLFIAAGVMFAIPDRGLMSTITDSGPGGRVARMLLPSAVCIPIGMGWLRLVGQRAGLYDTEVGVSIFVMVNVLAFAALIWWNARLLFQADQQRRQVEAELQYSASHDRLTGLANRALFTDRLGRRMKLFQRRADPLFAVCFLDLDGFKQVNDQLGHEAGDKLLIRVAGMLENCARTSDLVARLGGDEFTILLEDINHPDAVRGLADRILAAMPRHWDGKEDKTGSVPVGISIGIAVASPHYDTPEALLHAADTALYQAKRAGKGQYVIAPAPSAPVAAPDAGAPGARLRPA